MRRIKGLLSLLLCFIMLCGSMIPCLAVEDNGFIWNDESVIEKKYSVFISESGSYNIAVRYSNSADAITASSRAIYVDGKLIENFSFPQKWEYVGASRQKTNGDYIRPEQRQSEEILTAVVYEKNGREVLPISLFLEEGYHEISFKFVYGEITLYDVTCEKVKDIPDYQQYKEIYINADNGKDALTIQGEDVKSRSASSIRIVSNSDPATTPPSKGKVVFNTIGGASWSKGNQSITYEIDCKTEGYYKLSFRVLQKFTDGLPVFRQILIDGSVPFKEMLNYRFEYDDWKTVTLSNEDGTPYEFYLTKGVHTLEIKVVTESYADILNRLNDALNILTESVSKIVKITGVDPDINFDYKIDEKLPTLIEELGEMCDIIEQQCEALKNLSNKAPAAINSLQQISYRTEIMLKDPYKIPANLDFLTESQTTISAWISDFENLPLLLDYIEITPPSQEIVQRKSTFLQRIMQSIRTFLASFSDDYSTLSANVGEDSLKVWISRGKEWGEALQLIIEEDFTLNTGIEIDLNILPSGQLGTSGVLLLAMASGTQPDVALGADMLLPTEYGMRGAVKNLRDFEDSEDVFKRFISGALRAYTFEDAIYALPETVDTTVMYYRKDILENYNIDLNHLKTWDDLFNHVLPVLKQNGMDFWYEGGLNTFLYQNGGDFYTEDGKACALDTPEAFKAFSDFTDLYKIYDVPVAANFYTRFRSGQIPLGISSLNTYVLLQSASPDLYSKWGVTVIPSTVREDGSLSHACSGASTGAVILLGDKEEQAWEFLKWYTDYTTQRKYSDELLSSMGDSAIWFSANTKAFDALNLNKDFKEAVEETRREYIDSRNVVGGYITARHIENARVRAVVSGMNYREALEISVEDINLELARKQKEFDKLLRRKGEEA